MQDGFLPVDYERMARVVPTLETHDRMSALGEHVDDGAFALVAPLRTDHDDAAPHGYPRTKNNSANPLITTPSPKVRS